MLERLAPANVNEALLDFPAPDKLPDDGNHVRNRRLKKPQKDHPAEFTCRIMSK